MKLEIQSPGLFTTVQDLGRFGYGPLGVSASGAADPIALRLGNLLVGNAEHEAALEMTLLGGRYHFPEGATIAITGAQVDAVMWTALELAPGYDLRIGGMQDGSRAYLCVRGGVDVAPVLGSASTHSLTGLGGRRIQKGDVLRIGNRSRGPARGRIRPEALAVFAPRKTLRVTAGPQAAEFSAGALDAFYANAFRVNDEANRMGIRLEGPTIEAPHAGQMLTEGVSVGAVQVPAGGQPIILFVEMQTTGGYPKIANVISTDLASVGQLRPRDEIRFELVDMETARCSFREQEELLRSPGLFA
jgi:antagonist of KipI